jgi:hypothetical protein
MSVSILSLELGNYSNFNRQFKRIKGFGPMTLRKQFSAEHSVESHLTRLAASIAMKCGKMGSQMDRLS